MFCLDIGIDLAAIAARKLHNSANIQITVSSFEAEKSGNGLRIFAKYLFEEKYVGSFVICKAGFSHGPIVTKKVDRPFGFYSVRQDKGADSEINPA